MAIECDATLLDISLNGLVSPLICNAGLVIDVGLTLLTRDTGLIGHSPRVAD